MRAEEARATAEPEQEHTAQATQAEPEGAAQSASASADAERVQAEQIGIVPPQQPGGTQMPGGKTKRRKNNGWVKAVALLLIGAIIGGATGGVVGAKVGGSNTIQAVSTPRNTDEITYDESGNMTVSSIAAEATPAVVSVYNMTTQSAYGGFFGFGQQHCQTQGGVGRLHREHVLRMSRIVDGDTGAHGLQFLEEVVAFALETSRERERCGRREGDKVEFAHGLFCLVSR